MIEQWQTPYYVLSGKKVTHVREDPDSKAMSKMSLKTINSFNLLRE